MTEKLLVHAKIKNNILFVGLGNPTPDSENNRHNVGFKIIDAINKKFSLSKQKPKFKGLLTTGNIENKKVDFKFDGDMQPDVALNPIYRETYPFSKILIDKYSKSI